MFNSKVYDIMKYVVQVVLPAFAVLVGVLGPEWDLPRSESIVLTIVALNTFLGALLLVDNAKYNAKSSMEVGVDYLYSDQETPRNTFEHDDPELNDTVEIQRRE